jgi:hypothetical protein
VKLKSKMHEKPKERDRHVRKERDVLKNEDDK